MRTEWPLEPGIRRTNLTNDGRPLAASRQVPLDSMTLVL
jgi:hypothetical protein